MDKAIQHNQERIQEHIQEEQINLTVDGQEIYGMLHLPAAEAEAGYPIILLLHGFMGSSVGNHRMHVLLARHLAATGAGAVLRFDYRGYGQSQGDFEQLPL